jgi:hypothetical protein
MLEAEICQELEPRDDWHARWLEMQAAYAEYRRSSEALECTRQSGDDPLSTDCLRLAMLEGHQRLAFERYVDARIAFLESRFDDMNRADGSSVAPGGLPQSASEPAPEGGIKAWLVAASSRPVLQTLAVVLLCAVSFSLTREQQRVRDLEKGREELRAALLRTVNEVQSLRQRLDAPAPGGSTPPRIRPIPPAPAKATAPQRRAGSKSTPQQHAQAKGAPNRTAPAESPARPTEARNSYEFSLAPSREFKRVGPLSVWLKSIDPQKNSASVAVVSETVQVDVQLLKPNQPVWIHTAHGRRVGFVADRITRNRLDGHLVEADNGKSDLRDSRPRPALEGAP